MHFLIQIKRFKKLLKKQVNYFKKLSLNDILEHINFAKNVLQASKNAFGAGITLTDNGIKDFMKLIKSLENREILLKGTTRKTISQEGGFLNIFRPSMAVGLPNQMCADVSS